MKRIVIGDRMREITIEDSIKDDAYEYACMLDSNHDNEPMKLNEMDLHINDYIRTKYGDEIAEDEVDDLVNEVVEEWAQGTEVLYDEQDSDRAFVITVADESHVYHGSTAHISTEENRLDDRGMYVPVDKRLMTGGELYRMRRARRY